MCVCACVCVRACVCVCVRVHVPCLVLPRVGLALPHFLGLCKLALHDAYCEIPHSQMNSDVEFIVPISIPMYMYTYN